MKKTLIINGSPHKNGDTSYIIQQIKNKLEGEIEEINAYFDKISACIDCRHCWKKEGCAIKDGMKKIYNDDYDTIIIASPVHFYNVTPPMFSIITRLNMIWSNKHFLGIEHKFKEKQGLLVLVGGGSGEPKYALEMAKIMFRYLNAKFDLNNDYIYSLNTDTIPVSEDSNLKSMLEKILN